MDAAGPESPAAETPAAAPVENRRMRSFWQRAVARPWILVAWAVGAVVVVAVVTTVVLVSAPHPDTTLQLTTAESDAQIRNLLEDAPEHSIEISSLRGYSSYHGLDIWSGTNAFGSPCLIAAYRGSVLSEVRCTPEPAELIMDVSSSGDGFEGFDGLTGAGIIRFIHRGATVDAYVYLLQGTG